MSAQVLDVARQQLGTLEVPKNSNRTPYGRAYGWDGVAWCMIFCWYVLTQAGQAGAVPKTASTVSARTWYRGRGQWLDGPNADARPGDLVFFRFAGNSNVVNHVGIVEAVEPGGTLICIEGNTQGTDAGSQRDGGGVYRRRRPRTNVVGFARPAYAGGGAAPAPAPARPTLRQGATGELVGSWQEFLRSRGAQIDRVAGSPFGPQTVAATKKWQRDHGLDPDGVVGRASWAEADRQGYRP